MKQFFLVLFLGAALVAPVLGEGQGKYPPAKTVTALVSKIQDALPHGWTVSYDLQASYIEIKRGEKALGLSVVPNMSGSEKPEMTQYAFGFLVVPYLSKEKYARFRAENKPIAARMYAIENGLNLGPMMGGMDDFQPRNEEERKEVAEYKRLEKSLHDLPDYWFEDISLQGPLPPDLTIELVDKKIDDECQGARNTTLHLLSLYAQTK